MTTPFGDWQPLSSLPDWGQRAPRQWVYVEGEEFHSGTRWFRPGIGLAWITKDGPQGYRTEDLRRIEVDSGMDRGTAEVKAWMPGIVPSFPNRGDF
jgi:hypothetical protein